MTRQTVLTLALAILGLTGCGNRHQAPGPSVSDVKKPARPIYQIRYDRDESPARREVEVKLDRKVTPEELREIALKVKAGEERSHERTVIFYYLPVDFPELAGQPWASTHFKPELEVKILGLSRDEEDALRSLRIETKGRRIGAWLQDNPYKTLDLIYDDGGIKIAEISTTGSRVDSDMIELESPKGRRFKKVQGRNFYDVDLDGNLRVSNAEGQIISAAKPMR